MNELRQPEEIDHKDLDIYLTQFILGIQNKKAQLSLTNPRDACEKFARFT